MESDTSDVRKVAIEEMSKDEVIGKYNKVLIMAKKAKQSKDEMLEELKKVKDNETKLTKEVAALKEILNFFEGKQNLFAENEDKIKQIELKNKELKNLLQKNEEKYSFKVAECTKLEEIVETLNTKFTSLEKTHLDTSEKYEKLKENFIKIELENKSLQENLLVSETNKRKSKNENQGEGDSNHDISPEKLRKLIIENKKLQDFLNESEDAKAKLISELNFLKGLQGNVEKSEEHELLEKMSLFKRNEETFNIFTNKKDLVLSSLNFEELNNKLALLEEEKKNFDLILEESKNNFKALEKKFEEEKHEWGIKKKELEKTLKNQESEFQSNLKLYKKEIEELIKANKNLEMLLNQKGEEICVSPKTFEKEKACQLQTDMEGTGEKKSIPPSYSYNIKLSNLMEKIKLFSINVTKIDENKLYEEIQKLLEDFEVEMDKKSREWEQKLEKEQQNMMKVEVENSEKKQESLKNVKQIEDYLIESKEFKQENKNLKKKVKDLKEKIQILSKIFQQNGWENILNLLLQNEKLDKNEKDYLRKFLKQELEIDENIESHSSCADQTFLNPEEEDNNLQSVTLDNKDGKGFRDNFENNQHILGKENVFLMQETKTVKCNHEETMESVKKKLGELLLSFTKIKTLRYNFDEELKKNFKAFQLEQSNTKKNIDEVLTKYVGHLHNGNSELLSEMNDMNQVLKERGESISKLEQQIENQRKELEESKFKISSQNCKLTEKNKKMEEMEEEIGKVKLEVESKHRAMREMEEEIWKMKNNDSQTEVLSSSTLSRADESSRLMELEESFEERYSKLKIIALKLKKKANDLQKQFEAERDKLITTESEYQSKISNFQNQIKSLRNIQSEYDNLQDILDEERKEKNSINKTLESAQQELKFLKQQIEEIKAEREKFKSDKNSFERIKAELTAHLKELKQTIEKQKKDYIHLETQLDAAKIQLLSKDRHIEEEREKHKQAMLLLEESKQDSKKNSVLELEIAAYEKTGEDLKNRLDLKEKEIKELKIQVETEKEARELQLEEINNLKANINDGYVREDAFDKELKTLTEKLNSEKLNVQNKNEQIRDLERNIEERNLRIENMSLELKEITKEKYNQEEKFRSIEEKLSRQINSLEDKLFFIEDTLKQRDIELEELKEEYQAYKIRAQSVLRQSQKEINPSKQQNALEELEQLKSTSDSLKARLEESNKKIKDLLEESGAHQEEKKRLFVRVQELNLETTELRKENHELKEAKQKENVEHAEALRMQKHHSDTLTQCFQRQIYDLEAKHAEEVAALKKKQEEIKEHNHIFFKTMSKPAATPERRKTSASFEPVKPEKEAFDVMLLEREECEGSESVNSSSPQSPRNFMSLEQLLNDSNQSESGTLKNNDHDIAFIRRQLEKSENKIKHLTFLLSEAESDSARTNQLNEVLKEEIRRLQRSIEREKHAQNFEYLKNIIIKFVSLQSVDERLRLVPVLNTILKLSPNEESTLTNFAKGIVESGKGSWGINFGIWPNV